MGEQKKTRSRQNPSHSQHWQPTFFLLLLLSFVPLYYSHRQRVCRQTNSSGIKTTAVSQCGFDICEYVTMLKWELNLWLKKKRNFQLLSYELLWWRACRAFRIDSKSMGHAMHMRKSHLQLDAMWTLVSASASFRCAQTNTLKCKSALTENAFGYCATFFLCCSIAS